MKYEWDGAKRIRNIEIHGLDFVDAQEVLEGPCLIVPDDRKDYGEDRCIAFGLLKGRLTALVYTERSESITRIISFRKANKREERLYVKEINR